MPESSIQSLTVFLKLTLLFLIPSFSSSNRACKVGRLSYLNRSMINGGGRRGKGCQECDAFH